VLADNRARGFVLAHRLRRRRIELGGIFIEYGGETL
jgi:hypothetical protein